jgi:23S rRNA pseudouridine2605 synthase
MTDGNIIKRPPRNAPPGTRVNLMRAFTKKGISSRTQARDYILAGRVAVNGRVEKMIYAWVDLLTDEISLDGRRLEQWGQKVYVLFYKPAGYLTVRVDEQNRPTIYDVLPEFSNWIFPIGRLDRDSEGLLLLTNDGPFGEWLTNPDSYVAKTYRVLLDRPLQEHHRYQLEQGVDLRGYLTRPAHVRIPAAEKGHWAEITICEGKNRQVRRMFKVLDYNVQRLIRVRIGPVEMDELSSGQWRHLTAEELARFAALRGSAKQE